MRSNSVVAVVALGFDLKLNEATDYCMCASAIRFIYDHQRISREY